VTGFTDAVTTTITQENGVYLATVTLHLDARARFKRFDDEGAQVINLDAVIAQVTAAIAADSLAAPPAATTTDEDEDE
jgi:hypothetical protein